MLQSCTTVPLHGASVSENCLFTRAHNTYAFVSVNSFEEGEQFIQDLRNTKIDDAQLEAEWSSSSQPEMWHAARKVEKAGTAQVSYWHPRKGHLNDKQEWDTGAAFFGSQQPPIQKGVWKPHNSHRK